LCLTCLTVDTERIFFDLDLDLGQGLGAGNPGGAWWLLSLEDRGGGGGFVN
jgi:hypothetical protein